MWGGEPINYFDLDGLCPCGNPSDVIENARRQIPIMGWSYLGDKSYIHRTFGKNTYKCNLFVDFAYESADYHLPNVGGNWWSILMGYAPPGARDLSDPNYDLSGWPVQSDPVQPGDLLAYAGHVAIATGHNRSISAASKMDAVENNWGFREGQHPVIRRCSCDMELLQGP